MRKILQLLIIVVLLSGCVFVEKNLEEVPVGEVNNTENIKSPIENLATSTEEDVKQVVLEVEKVNLTINFGEEKKTVQVEFKDEMTVYDVLEQGAGDLGIILEIQTYSVGIFIITIGDQKNGQDNNYWTYYVNDKFANIAADKYLLKAGDKVEWKFS